MLIPESSVLLETRRLRDPCVFMFLSSACVVFHVCLSPFALYHVSHVGPNLFWLYKTLHVVLSLFLFCVDFSPGLFHVVSLPVV